MSILVDTLVATPDAHDTGCMCDPCEYARIAEFLLESGD